MRKVFFAATLWLLFTAPARACDICGCGVGNYYIGILPQFDHRFFGLRYHASRYTTRLNDDPSQFSKDFYQSVEAWGGWNIGRKFQLLAFIPYNFNHQNSDEGVVDRNGLGDITVVANYKLFSSMGITAGGKAVTQQLWLGAGVKLATGKFVIDPSDPDIAAIANGQLGSGTTDFILNSMYHIRVANAGFSASASYKMNTRNSESYKFGNRLSLNGFGYYTFQLGKLGIAPDLGLLYEHSAASELASAKIDLTGGYILNGSVGAEMTIGKVAIGANLQLPVSQNFADHQTKELSKFVGHVTVAF